MGWVRTHPNQLKNRAGRFPKKGAFPSPTVQSCSCWPSPSPVSQGQKCPGLLLPDLPWTPPAACLPVQSDLYRYPGEKQPKARCSLSQTSSPRLLKPCSKGCPMRGWRAWLLCPACCCPHLEWKSNPLCWLPLLTICSRQNESKKGIALSRETRRAEAAAKQLRNRRQHLFWLMQPDKRQVTCPFAQLHFAVDVAWATQRIFNVTNQ